MARFQRGLRFVHPDFDAGAPGLVLGATGRLDAVEGDALVRQAILLLLSTRPGERVMRPEYGCDLFRLAFSPTDETTAGLALHHVRTAIEQWEPRVELVHVDSHPVFDDPPRLEIDIVFRVRQSQRVQSMTLLMNLQGEGA